MSIIGKSFLDSFNQKTPEPEPAKKQEPEQEPTQKKDPEGTESKKDDAKVEPETQTKTEPNENTQTQEPTQKSEPDLSADDDKTKEPTKNNDEPTTQPNEFEVDDEKVLNYLKEKKGKELNSLDELFKEPEPQENPLEGLSEEAKGFVEFNKQTGRGYQEYLAVQRDLSQTNPVQIAREKAIANSDGYLNNDNVDEYLTEELGVDISDFDSMTPVEKMKLKNYGSDYLKEQKELQEKYKQPDQAKKQPEMVTLENGQKMPKETYDKLLDQQNQYQNNIKEASDNIKASTFNIKIDDNGVEKEMNLDYEYSKDEVHNMAKSALDIDKFYMESFGTKDGVDYAKLQEGLHWANPQTREKSIQAIVHKALAKQAEEFAELEHNSEVKTKSIPKGKNSKNKIPITNMRDGNQGKKIGFEPEDFNI